MKIKNKSLINMAYVYLLGNLKIDKNTIIDVPVMFTEEQVIKAIAPFPNLVLLQGSVVTTEDLDFGDDVGNPGVMVKDVYDTDYNNIVDSAEMSELAKTSIEIDFDFNDFASASKNIGTIIEGYNIENTKVIISIPFNNGAYMTIGDDLDDERLMDNDDSNLQYVNTYVNEKTHIYSSDTVVKLYFHNTPTTGSGKVVVFMS